MAIRFASTSQSANPSKPLEEVPANLSARDVPKIARAGKAKAWGVRLDASLLELIRRNSHNQTFDAEAMVELYASLKGWK